MNDLAGYESGPNAPLRAEKAALSRIDGARTMVLVEGISDQIAVETLADRLGVDFDQAAVVVVPIGGAQAIARYVERFGSTGIRLLGLCDRSERAYYSQAFGRLDGIGGHRYFVCESDLEEELIRAVDEADIEALLESHDDLRAFRTLQKQPMWREQPFPDQIHRWLRSVASRNLRYARWLLLAADDDRLPAPLVDLVGTV